MLGSVRQGRHEGHQRLSPAAPGLRAAGSAGRRAGVVATAPRRSAARPAGPVPGWGALARGADSEVDRLQRRAERRPGRRVSGEHGAVRRAELILRRRPRLIGAGDLDHPSVLDPAADDGGARLQRRQVHHTPHRVDHAARRGRWGRPFERGVDASQVAAQAIVEDKADVRSRRRTDEVRGMCIVRASPLRRSVPRRPRRDLRRR